MMLIDGDNLADTFKDTLCDHLYCWDCSFKLEDGSCKVEKWLDEAPTIEAVYICNRKRCDNCSPECDFTRDINYAGTTDKVFVIDNAPTIEPKRGEWKPKNHHTDYCSNCGFEETQWRTADYNFCPSCGARMKGADDEHTA